MIRNASFKGGIFYLTKIANYNFEFMFHNNIRVFVISFKSVLLTRRF